MVNDHQTLTEDFELLQKLSSKTNLLTLIININKLRTIHCNAIRLLFMFFLLETNATITLEDPHLSYELFIG